MQYKSVRVGLVTFHTNSTIVFHLDDFTETEDIRQAILEVPFVGGMTYTDDALDMARQRVFRVWFSFDSVLSNVKQNIDVYMAVRSFPGVLSKVVGGREAFGITTKSYFYRFV